MAATATVKKRNAFTSQALRKEAMTAYLFLAPYLIITLIFTVGILLYAVYIGFTKFNLFQPPEWVGVQNYVNAVQDDQFLHSLYNVFWYAIIVTPIQTALAIALAVLLNAPIQAKRFFRTIFYAPSVTSSVVISMIFLWLYQRPGFINFLLGKIGLPSDTTWMNDPRGLFQILLSPLGVQFSGGSWVGKGPSIALLAIMAMNIFTTAPTFMIMFLAALQDIPSYLYEAASLDGALGWTQFRRITLPLLRPIVLLVLVLGTIGTFQVFDQVNLMTAGGPLDTTFTPVYFVYVNALGQNRPPQMGAAAASAFILGAIIFLFTFIQRRFIETGTEQY